MLKFAELKLQRAEIAPDLRLLGIELDGAQVALQRRMKHPLLVLDHATVEPSLQVVRVKLARMLIGHHGALTLVIVLESEA